MSQIERAGEQLTALADLLFSDDHLWVRAEGSEAVTGVTAFACEQLGEIVYLELPEPGAEVQQGEPFGVIESVKTVSDLFAPLSGVILARNDAALETPELVGEAPYGDGWLLRVTIADSSQLDSLTNAATYRTSYRGAGD